MRRRRFLAPAAEKPFNYDLIDFHVRVGMDISCVKEGRDMTRSQWSWTDCWGRGLRDTTSRRRWRGRWGRRRCTGWQCDKEMVGSKHFWILNTVLLSNF